MRNTALRTYHRLPPSLRSVAATARGAWLRAWRYGLSAERLCDEARSREDWTAARWKEWQDNCVAEVLHRAATRVPYYRDQWDARRRRGDRASWQYIENWPILEKESLRQSPRAFVADDCNVERMFHDRTSGTSGKSLELWLRRKTVRTWYALFEARVRRWHGTSRHERWAILGGQLVVPSAQSTPPFWVWNAALHQLYLSTYHIAPRNAAAYVDALRQHRIVHLVGYPSSLAALGSEIIAQGLEAPRLSAAFTNAEPLTPQQREVIARAFMCNVRETYGMAEIVAAASECQHGRMHAWPEVGRVELLNDETPVASGDSGEFVCTGLVNDDMPLVRYRVGDRGAFADPAEVCMCGRTLPLIASIEGRTNDMLVTPDGRRIFWLNPVFYGLPIREGQIIQEALDVVRVRLAPGPGFHSEVATTVADRLRERFGCDVRVLIDQVDVIPRSANGKFRAVISNLPKEPQRQPTLS